MNIAILGFAGQGQSSYDYWNRNGNEITICDQDTTIHVPKGAKSKLGDNYLQNLDEFDLLIRTPALHPRELVNANDSQILDKVWSNTNEFFKVCPTKNIIGVTGTKGKGTTSTLIAKMLEASSKRVHLGGNIGTPPLDLLKENISADDWVVLELANFQLIDLKFSPHIAVCLMVVQEHLDWHTNYEEYLSAKQQLFINQNRSDLAIYYPKNKDSLHIASGSSGRLLAYYEKPGAHVEDGLIMIDGSTICHVNDLKLLGKHNWQNVCAAITAFWQVTEDQKAAYDTLSTFAGLENRLEFVRELDGIRYYNDSFGTTPETAIVAIEAFEQPKIIILGGSDKGSSYDELASTIASSNVKAAVVIGATGAKIAQALNEHGFSNVHKGGETINEIVSASRRLATNGDIVLLSTGSASFGLFKNYKDRGDQFKRAVLALA